MSPEHSPADEFPTDPEARERMKRLMPSEEEILDELDDRLDRPLTAAERAAGQEDREKIATYRTAHEKEEQEKIEVESLEGQITQVTGDLTDLYDNLHRRLQQMAEEGHGDESERFGQLIELEWTTSQNEIKAATPIVGWMGMHSVVPESKRRELLGALRHTYETLSEIKKAVTPSESGQE